MFVVGAFYRRTTHRLGINGIRDNRDRKVCGFAGIGTLAGSRLVKLEAILAIVHRGSCGAAAVDLGLCTTALSDVIGKLERQIGVRLLNRTTRSVLLPDAGRTFIGRSSKRS